jgi:hypothetical protein
VRTTAIGLLFVAEIVFFLTSGLLTAVAQPVSGSGTGARAGRTGRTGTNTKAEEELEGIRAAQRRVPCDQVTSRLDRDINVREGQTVDMSVLAKKLGTSVVWVERCMLAYGRRARRPGAESSESKEQLLESLEQGEPEERGPEDIREAGASSRREKPEQLDQQNRAERGGAPPR